MPTWRRAPDLDDTLHRIMEQLGEEVADSPSVEEVVGISSERLSAHALEAIGQLTGDRTASPLDPNFWVQLYCLGFVIGCKYGETRK